MTGAGLSALEAVRAGQLTKDIAAKPQRLCRILPVCQGPRPSQAAQQAGDAGAACTGMQECVGIIGAVAHLQSSEDFACINKGLDCSGQVLSNAGSELLTCSILVQWAM